MGYTTEFSGQFTLDKPLKPEHAAYLHKFAETRRMSRIGSEAAKLDDPVRVAAGLPVGNDGEYYVGGGGSFGQDRDASVIDYNRPPAGQPGLWNQWVPSEDNDAIEWDGGEKFYDYVDWLEYLIEHFLGPWGYTLTGDVMWRGESMEDIGMICVDKNVVTIKAASWK